MTVLTLTLDSCDQLYYDSLDVTGEHWSAIGVMLLYNTARVQPYSLATLMVQRICSHITQNCALFEKIMKFIT